MQKIYKGYELFKAISEGNIEENTKFKIKSIYYVIDKQEVMFNGNNLLLKDGRDFFAVYFLDTILACDFIILEENSEIDIQEIEEYEFPSYADKLTPIENKLLELVNAHTKAIKQLDRKVNEKSNNKKKEIRKNKRRNTNV